MIDETNNFAGGAATGPQAGQPAQPDFQQVPAASAAAPGTIPHAAAGTPPYAGPLPPAPGARSAFDGGNPSPLLAAVLGFIPGVGAVYNGQIAKGVAHVVIFVLLDSMKRANEIFGLFVALWVFYQVFDAYQTAIARRDGLALPDPLHLNNIGETFSQHAGGRGPVTPPPPAGYAPYAYPPASAYGAPAQPVAAWGGAAAQPFDAPQAVEAAQPVAAAQAFEAPASSAGIPASAYAAPYTASYTSPQSVPYAPVNAGAPTGAAWDQPGTMPTQLPPAYAAAASRRRFPVAAAWLLGIGAFFLIVNFFPQLHLNLNHIGPFVLIGGGVLLLLNRLARSGGVGPVAGEGEAYTARLVHSLRAPAVLATVGVLALVEDLGGVRMGRSWPILIIVIGALMLLERSMQARFPMTLAAPLPPVAPPSAPAAGAFAAQRSDASTTPGFDAAALRAEERES